jgi:hypothetical protein
MSAVSLSSTPISFGLHYAQFRRTLRQQYSLLQQLYEAAHEHQTRVEEIADEIVDGKAVRKPGALGSVMAGATLLALDEQMTSAGVRNIFAGTVADVLDSLLYEAKVAFTEAGGNAEIVGIGYAEEYPLWKVLRAIRNMYHHFEDWSRSSRQHRLNSKQKDNIVILLTLMKFDIPDPFDESPICNNLSLDALRCINSNYSGLDAAVRASAWEMIQALHLENDTNVVFAVRECDGTP